MQVKLKCISYILLTFKDIRQCIYLCSVTKSVYLKCQKCLLCQTSTFISSWKNFSPFCHGPRFFPLESKEVQNGQSMCIVLLLLVCISTMPLENVLHWIFLWNYHIYVPSKEKFHLCMKSTSWMYFSISCISTLSSTKHFPK